MILFVAGSWEGRAILDKEWVSSKGVDKLENFSNAALQLTLASHKTAAVSLILE